MTVTETPPAATDEPDAPSTELVTQPEGAAALAELAAGAGLDTIPGRDELAGLAAMAVTLAAAAALPDALRNRPNDVFLVLLTGRELGMGPAAAVRTLYVVNGRVTLPPKARAAAVRQRGLGRVWPHAIGCQCGLEVAYNDSTTATWHTTKADEGHQVTYSFTFTIEDAARVPEKPNSTTTLADKYATMGYPQRMLSWRALGYLLDDHYPEVGTGLYSADEMGAMVDEDGHVVIDVASTDPLAGMATPRGHAGATPPPPPPAADPEAIADLQARIAALPPEAKPALVELWTAPRDGVEPMVPVTHLLQRQLGRARGMVASIEARAKRGEWGPWPPADPDTGEVHPDTPPQPPTAPESAPAGTTAPPEGETAQGEPPGAAGCPLWQWCELAPGHPGECIDAIQQGRPAEPGPVVPTPVPPSNTDALIDHLAAQGKPWLVAQLTARNLGTAGSLNELRQRLGLALVAEGWVPPQATLA